MGISSAVNQEDRQNMWKGRAGARRAEDGQRWQLIGAKSEDDLPLPPYHPQACQMNN